MANAELRFFKILQWCAILMKCLIIFERWMTLGSLHIVVTTQNSSRLTRSAKKQRPRWWAQRRGHIKSESSIRKMHLLGAAQQQRLQHSCAMAHASLGVVAVAAEAKPVRRNNAFVYQCERGLWRTWAKSGSAIVLRQPQINQSVSNNRSRSVLATRQTRLTGVQAYINWSKGVTIQCKRVSVNAKRWQLPNACFRLNLVERNFQI